MDVGSAFAEYFERESRWRNDGREPSIPPSVSYIFSFPIPRSVFRFFPFVTTSSLLFLPPSLLYLFVSIPSSTPPPFFPTENSIVSLLFSSSTLPSSFLFRAFPSLVPLGRKIGEHTCQLPVVSLSSLTYVAQTASFLSLDISSFSFAPLQPPFGRSFLFFHSLFSLFPLGLTAAHASDHPGCEKRRVVWTEKRLIFIRSLSFSIVTLDPFVSYSVSLFLPLFFARQHASKRNDLKRGHVEPCRK